MHRFAVVCVLGLAVSACDNEPWRQGVPRPSPAASQDGYRAIALGTELKDQIANEAKYLVTAPESGTVTVQLDWVDRYLSDTGDQSLSLALDESVPAWGCGAERPLRASVAVDESQQVRIVVTRNSCWDFPVNGPIAPFTIKTSFEPHSP